MRAAPLLKRQRCDAETGRDREAFGIEVSAYIFPLVRRASNEDVLDLVDLSARLFPEQAWCSNEIMGEMAREGGWVRVVEERGGRVAGYLFARTGVDEVEILQFGVSHSFQGRGFGRWLLRSFLAEVDALEIPTVILEVRAANRVAQQLYEKEGFRRLGTRRAYYRRPVDDAVVMARLRP